MLQKMYFDKDGNLAGRTGPLGRGRTVYFMGRTVDIPETLVYVYKDGGGPIPMFINLTEGEIEERLTTLVKNGHKFEFLSLLFPNGKQFCPVLYPDRSKDGFFPDEWTGKHARIYERLEYKRNLGEWQEIEDSYKLIELPEV